MTVIVLKEGMVNIMTHFTHNNKKCSIPFYIDIGNVIAINEHATAAVATSSRC